MRPRAPLAAAAVTCLMLLSGCTPEAGKAAAAGAAGPGGPADAVEVGVVTLAARPLGLTVELPGRTVAALQAQIRPQVSGIIERRLYSEGSMVRAGQPLYQLDAAPYRAAHGAAQAAVVRAEVAVAAAQVKERRQGELFAADAGSRQDADDARANLRLAEADVVAARASLEAAAINLARTRISAPIAGRADMSSVTQGALVSANQDSVLTTVRQLDPMHVDIVQTSVERLRLQRQLADGVLKRGQATVELLLEDGRRHAQAGRLQLAGASVDATTGTVTLRATFPNPEGVLLPGMYVRARLEHAQDPAALLVPQAGIGRNARGGATALVVAADAKVEQRSVVVAEAIGDQWRVLEGLRPGDRVIVEGSGKVRPGQAVKAVAAGASAPASAAAAAAR